MDKRNHDVHPENGLINCKVKERGWVQLILFFHLIAAKEKPRVTTIPRMQCIYEQNPAKARHATQAVR